MSYDSENKKGMLNKKRNKLHLQSILPHSSLLRELFPFDQLFQNYITPHHLKNQSHKHPSNITFK